MDLNARVDVHCGRKDRRMDRWTENRTPISHLAKAVATKIVHESFSKNYQIYPAPRQGFSLSRINTKKLNQFYEILPSLRISKI